MLLTFSPSCDAMTPVITKFRLAAIFGHECLCINYFAHLAQTDLNVINSEYKESCAIHPGVFYWI